MADTTIDMARDHHALPLNLNLGSGMAWCLYSDEGPSGICGQSMDTTCPHTYLTIWPNEDAMRNDMEGKKPGRNGKRARVMHGVVGEWSTGKFVIEVRGQEGNSR